ncbi:MAG: hypothetical protein R2830_27175 [Saprospiraceae bacterium]
MLNSRLLELLRTLTPAELTAFGKYLRSPFFNHRDDVVRLFDYFFEKKEAKREEVFDKKNVFGSVFPGEKFDDKQLSYAMSFLYQAAQNFLVYNELMGGGEAAFQIHLARAMRKRGLDRQFETALKKAEDSLAAQPHRNTDFHYLSHLLHLEKYESGVSERRTASRSFQEMAGETDLYFIATKLRQGCTALMHKAVSETSYRLDLLGEVLAQVERQQLQAVPAIGIFYYAYRALAEEDSKPWFGRLREAVRLHFQQFPKAEMRDIYTLAVNYCIRQINTQQEAGGHEFYLRQVFEIYREGLENEVFTDGGVLSRFTYNNIANAGLGLKAFDWVEDFLKKYKDSLEPRHRESAYLFNLASLYFRKSDYGKVLDLLTQTEFNDLLHQLDARRMLLRSYYELGEPDALDSLLDSFQVFLRRRRDVGYLRQNYLNLIRFIKKLLQTPATDRAAREKLRKEIVDTKAVAEREWLLLKV